MNQTVSIVFEPTGEERKINKNIVDKLSKHFCSFGSDRTLTLYHEPNKFDLIVKYISNPGFFPQISDSQEIWKNLINAMIAFNIKNNNETSEFIKSLATDYNNWVINTGRTPRRISIQSIYDVKSLVDHEIEDLNRPLQRNQGFA